jgi:type VI secretion system secreted protein Hcp
MPQIIHNAMTQMNFLKIDQVEGESRIRRHEKEIEVLSWNWTVNNIPLPSSTTGAGAAAFKPVVTGVTFTHYVDIASPKLMKLCLGGTHVQSAVLSVTKDSNAILDYFKLTLDNVMITSVILSAIEGSPRTVETVIMEFTRVTEEYVSVNPTGAAGSRLSTSYDLNTGQIT